VVSVFYIVVTDFPDIRVKWIVKKEKSSAKNKTYMDQSFTIR